MEEVLLRFNHLGVNIFKSLDDESIAKCKKICKTWNGFIEDQEFLWIRIIQKINEKVSKNQIQIPLRWRAIIENTSIKDVKNFAKKLMLVFQLASTDGCSKIIEFLSYNLTLNLNFHNVLKIDLNAGDNFGSTAFHFVVLYGNFKMTNMLIEKSIDLDIELNAKDNLGRTAFHWACRKGQSMIIDLFLKKSCEFNIKLNMKDKNGRTAFHSACDNGKTEIVEMIRANAEDFSIDLNLKDNYGETGFDILNQSKKMFHQ